MANTLEIHSNRLSINEAMQYLYWIEYDFIGPLAPCLAHLMIA